MNSPKAGVQRNGKTAGSCPYPAPCGSCCQWKLWYARPCGRFQAYPAEPEKRPLHYVFQRGHPVQSLNVNESRVERWCQKVREPMLEKIRKLPSNTTMERLKREWYGGRDESYEHYNWTRYYALNLHSVFYRGTLEWRCFESTLHAGKVRANITLALAISAQAINQSRTVMRKTEISENPPLPSAPFCYAWSYWTGIQKCARALAFEASRRQGVALR